MTTHSVARTITADRESAAQIEVIDPNSRRIARENRSFLERAVPFLAAEMGIRQIIDPGSGLAASGTL